MSVPADYVGQRCRVHIPVGGDASPQEVFRVASETLGAKCQAVDCIATDITLISRTAWTEPHAGAGPYPDLELAIYEATAAPIGDKA
jgi:hypothetical protein